ncbi:hypothetical protein DVA86_18220 [Streptomyces armeniacus]|uniref:Orc1-like AAA ATPase domain-containing protein n=1 Tax=Streptomyces armeniacus TaxID=83291 RepID=A0A345XRN2_9ACTN|nr:AAA family ATPase [Streptomyces armeniacus]AXK34298.1 hypothetical protein DVA86_18220 [Streptomyces armeniacus]
MDAGVPPRSPVLGAAGAVLTAVRAGATMLRLGTDRTAQPRTTEGSPVPDVDDPRRVGMRTRMASTSPYESHESHERHENQERHEWLRRAQDRLAGRGSVVLHGPHGIGKTYAATALADARRERGELTLWTAPARAEQPLPYCALADLLRTVDDAALAALPAPQQRALRAVLRREPLPPGGLDTLALRLAVLGALGRLAAASAVLLVIDSAQWVDRPSTEVLAFVARRLDPARVHAVVTENTEPGGAPAYAPALCTGGALEIALPPLTQPEVAALLAGRGRPELPHWLTQRVYEASGGNPMFALEIARAIDHRGGPPDRAEPLPLTRRLREAVADRLDRLDPATRWVLLLAATAAQPTLGLLRHSAAARTGRTEQGDRTDPGARTDPTPRTDPGAPTPGAPGSVRCPCLRRGTAPHPPLQCRPLLLRQNQLGLRPPNTRHQATLHI